MRYMILGEGNSGSIDPFHEGTARAASYEEGPVPCPAGTGQRRPDAFLHLDLDSALTLNPRVPHRAGRRLVP